MNFQFMNRNVTTMICNILCLIWIIVYIGGVGLFGYPVLITDEYFDHETLHVFVLVLADTFISVSLLIMVFYNRCIKTHTDGCVLVQLSQPAVLSPPHATYQEQDHLAPSAPPEEKYF